MKLHSRATVAVVFRVRDVLEVRRDEDAAPEVRGVIRRENILPAIS